MNQKTIDITLDPLDIQNCIDGKIKLWKLFNINGEDTYYCTLSKGKCNYQGEQDTLMRERIYYFCNKSILK